MNCIIPSLNVKVLAKGLQALAKIGDDLFIEFKKELISFVTLNQSKTVCTRFNLLDSFFSSYEADEDEIEAQSNKAITCKIHLKILLPLFKGIHLEKKLEYVKLSYELNADIIVFKMKYKCDDILMVHKLRLMDTEVLKIGVNTSSGSNNMCATSSFYNQLLTMFSNSDDEITLEIEKDKLVARNYFLGAPPRPKSVRSHVNLNGHEFLIYKIENDTTINFSLKPFRTAIQFADGLNLNVGFNFEKGGRPMSVLMKNPTFELIFIIATLNPYSDAQSTIATTSIPAKITQLSQNGVNITVEDQQALLNEDWDEFDMEEANKEGRSKKSTASASTKSVTSKKSKSSNEIVTTKSIRSSVNSTKRSSFKELMERPRLQRLAKENLVSKSEEDCLMDVDVLPRSPESPRSKKAKMVFGRCMDPTFSATILGEVLAGNSDSD